MIFTPEDIREVRPISENVNDIKRLSPYIDECENLFLIPAIGSKQYKALEEATTPLTEELENLLNGCYYADDAKYCSGLKKAMGYLVYSRFVRNQQANATAFGMVTKRSEFSEPLDEKTIVRIANDAEKIGLEYLQQCVDYYNYGKECSEKQNYTRTKIKIIGD